VSKRKYSYCWETAQSLAGLTFRNRIIIPSLLESYCQYLIIHSFNIYQKSVCKNLIPTSKSSVFRENIYTYVKRLVLGVPVDNVLKRISTKVGERAQRRNKLPKSSQVDCAETHGLQEEQGSRKFLELDCLDLHPGSDV
jgi:hypothetical protein